MFHEPVLREKVVEFLFTDSDGVYIDATVGGGGHAEAIADRLSRRGRLIGLDRDPAALKAARKRLRGYGKRVKLEHGNFRDLVQILDRLNIGEIAGVLFDFGISSHQIDTPERGFSFDAEGALDMRMNPQQKLTAREIVNTYSVRQLTYIFRNFGEERRSRPIAQRIVRRREKAPIETTQQLKEIIGGVTPYRHRVKTFARIFQALRIAVNDELQNLRKALDASVSRLKPGGRLVGISYHSLEDRIVKQFFKQESPRCVCPPESPVCICGEPGRLLVLTGRPVRPPKDEVDANPRSRSARLRAAERL